MMTEKKTPLENPLRLTVGNLKGGVARSTTSIMLALALVQRTGQQGVPQFFIDGRFLATTRKLGSQGGNADGKGNPREGTGGGRAMKIRHAEFLEYGQD